MLNPIMGLAHRSTAQHSKALEIKAKYSRAKQSITLKTKYNPKENENTTFSNLFAPG